VQNGKRAGVTFEVAMITVVVNCLLRSFSDATISSNGVGLVEFTPPPLPQTIAWVVLQGVLKVFPGGPSGTRSSSPLSPQAALRGPVLPSLQTSNRARSLDEASLKLPSSKAI
jgi:hypothetical protein